MAARSLDSQFPIFTDVDGQPLDAGYLYVGTVNLNPETNPIQVYWDQALTITAAQPIRTLNGYPSRSGSPAVMYVNADDYSLTVRNKNSTLVHSVLSSTIHIPAASISADDGSSGSIFTTVQGFITKILSSAGSSIVGFLQAGTSAAMRSIQSKTREIEVSITDYTGADPTGGTASTAALQSAITALRLYPEDRIDTIGGSTITMYRSGVVKLPAGIFKIPADTLEIVADMGLTFRGAGSRRFTNAIQGRTTLLITGTSAGYGIKIYRNGARSVHFEDLDICYESNTFTGHLIDTLDAPSTKFRRCYLGTYGITSGTRYQTAASLMRLTYDEDMSFEDCTLDGAVDGIWVDDTRTELGNTFGGWGLVLNRCTFYDFTGTMVRHDGNRTLANVSLRDVHFNPINVNCVRAVDLNNIDGLVMDGCIYTPSTTAKASTEWMRLVNVTGRVSGNNFYDLAKAGTLNGNLEVTGNICAGTDGFTLTGGVITGRSNEFSTGTNGWTITPVSSLAFDLGPDLFKGLVTNSYKNAADSASIAGRINYDATSDASSGKFSLASGRIRIENIDKKMFSVSTTPYTISVLDTGRTVRATGGAGQVFTLPTPAPGCVIRVFKASSQTLQINGPAATSLYAGTGGLKSSVSAAGADVGGWVEFEAWDAFNWVITNSHGTWTLA